MKRGFLAPFLFYMGKRGIGKVKPVSVFFLNSLKNYGEIPGPV
jgi:hypothetical protein